MKTIFDHIEHVKGKPHHVRRKVTMTVAAGASLLIGLVWFAGNAATNAFSIQGSNFAMSADQSASVVPVVNESGVSQNLAGVAAAAAVDTKDTPAHIEIVDTTPPAPAKSAASATILPF